MNFLVVFSIYETEDTCKFKQDCLPTDISLDSGWYGALGLRSRASTHKAVQMKIIYSTPTFGDPNWLVLPARSREVVREGA